MIRLFALTLAIVVAIAIPSFASPKVSPQNLAIISDCIKTFRVKSEKTAIIQIYDGPIYQVVRHGIDNSGSRSYMPFLVKVKGKKCELIYSSYMGEGDKISDAFPNEFGRIATRNYYRYLIQVQGRAAIQRWLDSGSGQLNQTEKKQLESLGFRVK